MPFRLITLTDDLDVTLVLQDYADAFEKLLKLSLTHQQEREILHITMDVCLQETPYNPYYALIAQKFSECHRRHQVRGHGLPAGSCLYFVINVS